MVVGSVLLDTLSMFLLSLGHPVKYAQARPSCHSGCKKEGAMSGNQSYVRAKGRQNKRSLRSKTTSGSLSARLRWLW